MLILQFEDRVLKQYSMGLMATIGRVPDNTVVIDNPAVSSHHACVFRSGDDYVVEDFQSTNGTFVNGKRVTRQTLRDGDVLLVGKHKLAFDKMAAESVEPENPKVMMPDVEGTVLLDTNQHRALLAQLDIHQGIAAILPPAKVGVLRVLAGPADRLEYDMEAQTTLIGKSDAAVVRLKGWFKPSVAVAITRRGGAYTVTPLGGKPLINDRLLSARQQLKEGDVLRIHGLTLEFRLKA